MSCAHHITIFTYEGCKIAADCKRVELETIRRALSPVLRYSTAAEGEEGRPEEDVVVSFIVGQIEMEEALAEEYDKITAASKAQAFDLQTFTAEFEAQQSQGMSIPGAWFDEHRETMRKHAGALESTLLKVRDKVDGGYANLQSRIAALDYDAEQQAEEELAAVDPGDDDSIVSDKLHQAAAGRDTPQNRGNSKGVNRSQGSLLDPSLYDV